MFAAGIALKSMVKLFSYGTTSQKLGEHTDGRKVEPVDLEICRY